MNLNKVVILKSKAPPLSYLSMNAHPGDLVLVPIRDRVVYGVVVGEGVEKHGLRRIKKVVTKNFMSAAMLNLMKWISEYYLASIADVVRMAIPKTILPSIADRSQLVKEPGPVPKLNRWQSNAVDEIGYMVQKRIHKVFVLFGITGSGKTEVYIKLIQEALKYNMGTIFLYPEIGLTPLYQERFKTRFPTMVLHSGLSPKQRKKNWHTIKRGDCSVAVGPRSAIFAPVNKPGIIIVDEEHSTSYKEQFRSPRYHARDVAITRGRFEKCPVVLGSATPAIDTYHKAMIGDYKLIRLPRRVGGKSLPKVHIVDLKREKRKTITEKLMYQLKKTVTEKNQAIIFINRKGYAPVVICTNCGYSSTCHKCGIPLVYFQRGSLLKCPYCTYQQPMIKECPKCGNENLRMLGSGTERIEERLSKIFNKNKVLRFDRDMVRKELYELYTQFQNRDRLMMVGTSLVTKGHDFPYVTLVGVINGDQILNLPDFRAGEFTFQTLSQVAGRAGRGPVSGRVLIQTYQPDHSVFQALKKHDYQLFYTNEIMVRKELNYPPFTKIIIFRFSGPKLNSLTKTTEKIKRMIPEDKEITVMGPTPALRKKVGKNYNLLLMLKLKGDYRWLKKITQLDFKEHKMSIDVDPVSVL